MKNVSLLIFLLLFFFESASFALPNLVINEDFETGDFFGWTSYGTSYVVSDSLVILNNPE